MADGCQLEEQECVLPQWLLKVMKGEIWLRVYLITTATAKAALPNSFPVSQSTGFELAQMRSSALKLNLIPKRVTVDIRLKPIWFHLQPFYVLIKDQLPLEYLLSFI